MSDLIDRREAITIPILPIEYRKYQTMNLDDAYELGWFDCQDCIEALPAAEPKVGKRINDIRYSGWTCTHCNYHDGNRTDKYCPNCGARMKGASDEPNTKRD